MSNKSAYKKFMSKKVEVPLDEDTVIQLNKPRANATIDLRAYMQQGDEEQEDNARMLKVVTRALGHCMPTNEDWSEEELMDLIVASGGELSELSMKAMSLCGMPTDRITQEIDKAITEDPSLSPEATE